MVAKLRSPNFDTIKVIIDFEGKTPNFVRIETMNGKLIAFGEWNIDKRTKNMYISDVTVQLRYRSKGYGSLLVRILFSIAKYYKVKVMSLVDGSSLPGFWQRFGFKWDKKKEYWVLKTDELV